MQHCNPQLLLEFGHLTAECRLRHVDEGSGTREAAGLHDLHEVMQLTQFDNTALRTRPVNALRAARATDLAMTVLPPPTNSNPRISVRIGSQATPPGRVPSRHRRSLQD